MADLLTFGAGALLFSGAVWQIEQYYETNHRSERLEGDLHE